MSFTANDLSAPAGGTYIGFKELGEKATGTIVYVGDWEDRVNPNNNNMETQAKVVLDDNGYLQNIYITRGKAIAEAVGNALRAHGNTTQLLVGGTLTVEHHELKATGKPNKFKMFRAKYEPPSSSARSADDFAPARGADSQQRPPAEDLF